SVRSGLKRGRRADDTRGEGLPGHGLGGERVRPEGTRNLRGPSRSRREARIGSPSQRGFKSDRVRPTRSGPPAFVPSIGLREVLEASPDLVFSTDAWGRLVWASPTFESITGRKVKDCVGHSVLALVAPSSARAAKRMFVRARRRASEPADQALDLVT